MNPEWQVKSVVKSGDSIHVELQQQDSTPVGPITAVAATAVIAVIAWAFITAGIIDPAVERNRIWTAATNQLLECSDSAGNRVIVYWPDVDTIQAVQQPARGASKYESVTVEVTSRGATVQGPDVNFEYSAATRLIDLPVLGAGQSCQVRLVR